MNTKNFITNARNTGKAAMCGIVAAIAVTAFSCGKIGQPTPKQPTEIKCPNLEEANKADIDNVVAANGLLTATYGKTGFTITLPAEVPDSRLSKISLEGLTVSNPNFKVLPFSNIQSYKNNNYTGLDFKYGYKNSSTEVSVEWWYVDESTTIYGSRVYKEVDTKYNLPLKKGWNTIYYVLNIVGKSGTVSLDVPYETLVWTLEY